MGSQANDTLRTAAGEFTVQEGQFKAQEVGLRFQLHASHELLVKGHC